MSAEMSEVPPQDREVAVMKVVVTNILRRGKGTDSDPIRIVRQVWSEQGELLAEMEHGSW